MISSISFRLKKNGEPTSNCFCRTPELIENYELAIADKDHIWDCHHRKEEFYSQQELVARGEYFDRPPEELIFLLHGKHTNLHQKGKIVTDTTRKKLSNANKGKCLSEETKEKISKASTGRKHSDESKKKISESNKGKHRGEPWNKGKKGLYVMSEETRKKMSETRKGHPGWNKGKHLSEEAKKKISEKSKQMWENMSEDDYKQLCKKHSENMKKIRATKKWSSMGMVGKHHSEESKQKTSDALLEHFKQKDYEKYGNAPKKAPQITDDRAFKISLTLRSKKSIWVKMDKMTEWGDMLTTRQIAELNGNTASGAVKQKIAIYGYVNIRHIRYYCRLATEDEVKEYLAKFGVEL